MAVDEAGDGPEEGLEIEEIHINEILFVRINSLFCVCEFRFRSPFNYSFITVLVLGFSTIPLILLNSVF